jgi:hypothetical protein
MPKGEIVIRFDTERDYVGAHTTYPGPEGTDYTVGNDLPDGKINEETIAYMEQAIRDVLAGKRS